MTKRLTAILCVLIVTLSMSACAKGVGQAASSEESMPIPSQMEENIESSQMPEESSTPSSQQQSSDSGSSEESAASTTAKPHSEKAAANLNTGEYKIKTSKYSYQKDNLNYSAQYPQLTAGAKKDAVNKALETSAMKTIQSMGTAKKEQRTSVWVTGDVTYEGKNFLSAGFNEYVKLSPNAKSKHVMRTVNVNLKTGTAVSLKDMITTSDAFYQALEAASKQQNQSAALTAAQIKSGLNSDVIYFTGDSVGFAVELAKPEQKLVRITLDYTTAKPFMTKNENWGNFI